MALLASGRDVHERRRVPTTDPPATLAALADQLSEWREQGYEFGALGIASFGPVGLDVDRDDYGHITTTPKRGWSTTDVRGTFSERFDVPIGFDLDVIGAALAERRGALRRAVPSPCT